jgi:hypothetical protein
MNRFFVAARFLACACALFGSLQIGTREAALSAPNTFDRNARADIVDFASLHVRGTGDLYAKLVALPKDARIGFGGKVTTVGRLMAALRQHPIPRTRRLSEGAPAMVSLLQLNSPATIKKANISALQIAAADVFKQVIPLPPTQSSLPDGPSVCGKHTLCATFFPTYQTTQSPCDGAFGVLECDPIPGACGIGTASPCPQATATPASASIVVGGCIPDATQAAFAAASGSTPNVNGDCAWNPVQTGDVTIADSFAVDFYEKTADCDANGFVVDIKAGADDGVARTIHMRITQPNPPQQPLAQQPSQTMAVCAVTVYIVGPKGQTWQF